METHDLRDSWTKSQNGRRGPKGKAIVGIQDGTGDQYIFGSVKQAETFVGKRNGSNCITHCLCEWHPTHHIYGFTWAYYGENGELTYRESGMYWSPWDIALIKRYNRRGK
jgi:hypothetical protein